MFGKLCQKLQMATEASVVLTAVMVESTFKFSAMNESTNPLIHT